MTAATVPVLAGIWQQVQAQGAALDAGSAIVERFRVAHVDCTLAIHGAALAEAVLPPISGLPAPAGGPAVEMQLWDHHATGTGEPHDVQVLRHPTVIPRYVDARRTLRVEPTATTITQVPGTPGALFTCDDATELPHYVRAAPLPHAFAALLAPHGLHLMHAACVGLPGLGGVLLAGRGGSGKSTTALICLRDGWQYVGDDYVVVDPAAATAHRLYATGKIDPTHLATRPQFLPAGAAVVADPTATDKSIAVLLPALAGLLVHDLPIRAIVRCTVAHRPETTWRRIPAGEALLALAPSTLLQLPTGGTPPLPAMAGLVRALPTCELAVGTELDEIAPTIKAMLIALQDSR